MNHDVVHCSALNPTCPKTCYWVKLDQDLRERFIELAGVPISYMDIKNMRIGLCPREDGDGDAEF